VTSVHIDHQARTITFRVLYHGAAGATKLLNLRGLQSYGEKQQRLAILHAGEDRIATVPVACTEEPPVMGFDIAFQAVAVAGDPSSPAVERLLVATADAVVALPERELPGSKDTRRALTRLTSYLKQAGVSPGDVPIFVQDYADGPSRLEPRHLDAVSLEYEPKFIPVRGDTPETTLMVFNSARDSILESVRGLSEELGDEEAHQRLMKRAVAYDGRGSNTPKRRRARWTAAIICAAVGAAAAATFVSMIA